MAMVRYTSEATPSRLLENEGRGPFFVALLCKKKRRHDVET